jgi:two-component system KDP operon response regulator KdpE
MSEPRVLVVDDEPQIRRALGINLRARGYEVDLAETGEVALDLAARHHPDVVILDLGLPGIGGVEVIQGLRGWSQVPIIVLSVRDAESDKVAALDAGADDFVTKPFSTPELLARIRAALRRIPVGQSAPSRLRSGELSIDFSARTVAHGGASAHLTPKELDLLRYLTQHANEAVPHRELLQAVWGPDYGDQVDYLRVFIKSLRKKLEPDPEHPRYILTEPWIGYRFNGTFETL